MTYHIQSGVDPSGFQQAVSRAFYVTLLLAVGIFGMRVASGIQLPDLNKQELSAQTAVQTVLIKSTIQSNYSVVDLTPCGCPNI